MPAAEPAIVLDIAEATDGFGVGAQNLFRAFQVSRVHYNRNPDAVHGIRTLCERKRVDGPVWKDVRALVSLDAGVRQ